MRICQSCQAESPNEAKFCFNPMCRKALDPLPSVVAVASAPTALSKIPLWAKIVIPVLGVAVVGGLIAALRDPTTPIIVATTTTAEPKPASTLASTTVPAPTTTTTTIKARGNPLPRASITGAKASSTLVIPGSSLIYDIDRTLDGSDNTAWNSAGTSEGASPNGQTLTYTFGSPQHLVGIRIRNGFDRPTEGRDFNSNHRVMHLKVTVGDKNLTYKLDDTNAPRHFEFEALNAQTVIFEIIDTYPTTKYDDVAITDIQFFVV